MKKLLIILSILWLGCLISCNNDDPVQSGGGTETEEEVDDKILVQFQIYVPGPSSPTSRALTEEDEYAIKTIDLLLFRVWPAVEGEVDATTTFFAHAQGEDILQSETDSKVYTFKSYIEEEWSTSQQFQAVVLTNLHDEVATIMKSGTITTSTTKNALLSKIEFAIPQTGWNSTSGTDFRALPMWGESQVNYKQANWSNIQLLRAVARIDIGVGYTSDLTESSATGLDNFILKEAWVYNVHRKGAAVPLPAHYDAQAERTIQPTIPTHTETPYHRLVLNPGGQESTPYVCATGSNEITRSIYIPEFKLLDTPEKNAQEVTCLVIGGKYGDESAPTTYYRVDFFDPATSGNQWMNILRNHRYRFNIRSVDAAGYSTPDEAFENAPANMQGDLVAWDDNNLNETITNGEYSLSVSTSSLLVYRQITSSTVLDVQTTLPQGWTVEYPSDPWFTVSPESYMGTERTQVIISPTSENNMVGAREQTFYIVSGTLRKAVTVTQSHRDAQIVISVTPEELIFTQNGYKHQSVAVTISPASLLPIIGMEGDPMDWRLGFAPSDYSGMAFTEMKLHPMPNQGAKSGSALIIVQQDGQIIGKAINIRILDERYNFEKEAATPSAVSWRGESGTVRVTRSDLPFFFFYKEGDETMVKGANISYPAVPQGNFIDVPFTVPGNPTSVERTVTLQFGAENPNFPDGHTFTLTQEPNNSRLTVVELNGQEVTAEPYELDFGSMYADNATRSFTFRTNREVKLTPDVNASKVFTYTGESPIAGPEEFQEHYKNGKIAVAMTEVPGIKAGEVLTANLVLTTVDPIATLSKTIKVSRVQHAYLREFTIKAHDSADKWWGTSEPTKADITAAAVNTKWQVKSLVDNTIWSTETNMVTVDMPFSPTGYKEDRTCLFQTRYLREDGITWSEWEDMEENYVQRQTVLFYSAVAASYSYKAGSYTLDVLRADAPYRFSYAADNPATMDETEYSYLLFGNEKRVTPFNLTENPTFATRTVSMNVVSDEPKFPKEEKVTIVQIPNVAELSVKEPETKLVDFGESYKANTVMSFTLLRNANMSFTYDSNYSTVCSTAKKTTVSHPNGDASQDMEYVYELSPITTNKACNETTTITIKTTNTGSQPAKTETVNVKRIWPERFSAYALSKSTISALGGTITASASTNTKWRVVRNTSTYESPGDDNAATNQEVKVSIPAAAASKWTGTNTHTLTSGYKAYSNNRFGDWVNSTALTVTQSAYTISSTTELNNIAAGSTSIPVKLKGVFPSGTIQAYIKNADNTNTPIGTSSAITAGASADVTVPCTSHTSWTDRTIYLRFIPTAATTSVQELGSISQGGYGWGTRTVDGVNHLAYKSLNTRALYIVHPGKWKSKTLFSNRGCPEGYSMITKSAWSASYASEINYGPSWTYIANFKDGWSQGNLHVWLDGESANWTVKLSTTGQGTTTKVQAISGYYNDHHDVVGTLCRKDVW